MPKPSQPNENILLAVLIFYIFLAVTIGVIHARLS